MRRTQWTLEAEPADVEELDRGVEVAVRIAADCQDVRETLRRTR